MKNCIKLSIIGLFIGQNVIAQEENWHEYLKELKEKSDKFNVYLNTQISFEIDNQKDSETEAKFKFRQLRLEFRGDLTDKIFYRIRHRLNKSNTASSLDNLADATDMAYVGFRVSDKWSIQAGKISQDWGGFEFDPNPIYIYEYSEFVNHMDNYLVGASATYIPNERHEFNFNLTNSRTEKFEKIYGENTGIRPSKMAFAYLLNWNGNFWDNRLQTRWALGYHQDAKNYGSTTWALGTKINLQKIQFFVDYYGSYESLDRLNYANKVIGTDEPLKNVAYHSWVSKISFQPNKNWNIFTQGMYETYALGTIPIGAMDTRKKSIGYQAGVEYMPFKNQNMKLFATFLGKKFTHQFKEMDYYTHRISLGMVYMIKAF